MERLMEDSILNRIRNANMRLRELLGRTRDALAGRRNFTVEDVRAIAEPVAQMEPIVAEAKRLRTLQPELDGELEAMRGHLETVGLWTAALSQTR
jgi:hypothetical protein